MKRGFVKFLFGNGFQRLSKDEERRGSQQVREAQGEETDCSRQFRIIAAVGDMTKIPSSLIA